VRHGELQPVEAVIAMGANLGHREATLRGAVQALDAADAVAVQRVSPAVETAPVGGPEQPDYLNAVALVSTTLDPEALLELCLAVEAGFGRERQERWGPRTLDLDLIAYGRPGSSSEVVSDDPRLTLPHPRAHERAFVLFPWLQVAPHALLRTPDGAVRPVSELLDEASDRDGVRLADLEPLR
jgi:2-amino-4-hydroxy-6-hydroxymethyldihydropteridine diphosphokinase